MLKVLPAEEAPGTTRVGKWVSCVSCRPESEEGEIMPACITWEQRKDPIKLTAEFGRAR
jgi:hypothetical protein